MRIDFDRFSDPFFDLVPTARPYESCTIFKGRPHRNAFSKLVHHQYKSFPTDRFCQAKSKTQLGWVIDPVPHNLVRRIRFWRNKISGTWFKIFVLNSKYNIYFWHLFTCKGTYIINWVRRIPIWIVFRTCFASAISVRPRVTCESSAVNHSSYDFPPKNKKRNRWSEIEWRSRQPATNRRKHGDRHC